MTLDEVVRALGIADGAETLKKEWEESQATLPKDGIPFLSSDFVRHACREVGMADDVAEAVVRVCGTTAGSEALAALAWHCHRALFAGNGYSFDDVTSWPSLEGALGADADTFYLLVLLSGVPRMRQVNLAHRVAAEVERDTLGDVLRSLERHRRRGGGPTWGLHPHEVAWFANFIRCDLYRLGRLQFQFGSFYHRARAFRHTSGAVLALSEAGVGYDSDGQVAASADNAVWTAELVLGRDRAVGNPILPTGQALPGKVTLPSSEWKQVLAPGDPILNVHMPGGGPLAHDACGESFRRAVEFFPRHFPERPFTGFCCHSWLLDAQLEQMLPPSSNMVRLQRKVYLLPTHMEVGELLRTALGRHLDDLSKAPRKTTLQRAIVERLERGEKLRPRAGGFFLLPEDLNWGGEVYRSQQLERFLH